MITPGECRVLLGDLVVDGRVDAQLQRRLEEAEGRIDGILCEALLEPHFPPLLREVVATILGERRNPKVIPHLITALADRAEIVRYDALIAIEKCAGLEPGTLVEVLRLDRTKPKVLQRRVKAWWELVHT